MVSSRGRGAAPSSPAPAPPARRAPTDSGHTKPARRARRSAPHACVAARRQAAPGWASGGGRPGRPEAARIEPRREGARRGRRRSGKGRREQEWGPGGGWRKRPRAEEGAIEFQTQTTARARTHRAGASPPIGARPVRAARGETPWPRRSSGRGPPSRQGPREGRSGAAPPPPHAPTWARASRPGAEPGAPGAPPCRDPTGRRSTNAGIWCSPR